MLWKKIINLPECKSIKPSKDFSEFFLLKNLDDTHWLIGQYKAMAEFATTLRSEKILRDFLSAKRIRIGLRATDIPPADIDRQKRYGVTVRGENYSENFTAKRLNLTARPVRELKVMPINRITDNSAN